MAGRFPPCASLWKLFRDGAHGVTRPTSALGSGAQRGVALIVTIIMLSVITFLAVAFLALMGREKGSVKIATDQTIARLASDTARERAQAELLATILATTNLANFDLLVSTNFVRWEGFDSAVTPATGDPRTNVNYDYQSVAGNPALTPDQALQNLASLFYNPRPPVFITNRLTGGYEFRFFNDLNRNHRYDRTGFWPLTNDLNLGIFTNGILVTNYLVGDPEWLGGLERADLPHSPSNRFTYRYSYLVVPAGKTLDLNYIHNQARVTAGGQMNTDGTDYFRNEGVGSWEINLAAFLYDLNTNSVHGWGAGNVGYVYDPLNGLPLGGWGFYDAAALYRYRLNGNPNTLTYNPASVVNLFGAPGVTAFQYDHIDGYTDGLLLSTNVAGLPSSGLTVDPDLIPANLTGLPWPGAPQANHFFTPQDLFNPAKTDAGGGNKFTDRLTWAGTNVSTYDQYTYYRLLSQLGTDSAPEDPDKLNLNYINVSPFSSTNFIRWDNPQVAAAFGLPQDQVDVVFFTNAVDRLLAEYSAQWLTDNPTNYIATFGTNQPIRMGSIPVWVNAATNRWAYTPSVHRLLQIAANIIDARTNRANFLGGADFPTVFRPVFRVAGGNVYITTFRQVTDASSILGIEPRDLVSSNAAALVLPNDLIYNVPLVIGAKKGFPNFNEFAMQNVFQITRKLQVTRNSTSPTLGRPINTNMMYVLGVSNALGMELWNSYASNYTRPVDIYVTNSMYGALTNSDRGVFRIWPTNVPSGNRLTTTIWPANRLQGRPNASLVVPLNTNIVIEPQSIYNLTSHSFQPVAAGFVATGAGFPQPLWGLNITNRVQVVMVDSATRRIVDYAHFSTFNCQRDLSEEIRDKYPDPNNPLYSALWSTNPISGTNLTSDSLPQGVFNQINISMGGAGTTAGAGSDTTDWNDYGIGQASMTGKNGEIAYFRKFNSDSSKPMSDWIPSVSLTITDLVHQVPFTPTKIIARAYTWQANDPLVHYLAEDLRDFQAEDNKMDLTKSKTVTNLTAKYLGQLNNRYQPWGGYPLKENADDRDKFNGSLKDPSVRSSDAWSFMTNAFPTVGWLGRVHRGTPWQTIYLKSQDVNLNVWTNWAGTATTISNNFVFYDAERTLPRADRLLFDVFTTAFDDNAARGQLSVNQSGLAAWSAVFSGMVALKNTNSLPLNFEPVIIQPAGYYDSLNPNTWSPLVKIVAGINRTRADTNLFPQGTFQHLGDILAVPELSIGDPVFVPSSGEWYWTNKSPYLELGGPVEGDMTTGPLPTTWQSDTLTDAAVEWLPQQVMSLVRLGEPRFVIYAYGQALHPAANSVLTSGPYFQMCTNYQITAEVATRAVVRVEGSPDPRNANHPDVKKRYPPHLVVESFNYLPPD